MFGFLRKTFIRCDIMFIVVVVFSIGYPISAKSNAVALGLVQYISIDVSDEVTGKCWTNVDHVRERVRLELQRSKINIVNYDYLPMMWAPVLSFQVHGMRTGSGCLWNARMTVQYVNLEDTLWADGDGFRFLAASVLWEDGSFGLASPNANEPISSFFEEAITKFLLRIERNKSTDEARRIKELFPSISNVPPRSSH